MKILARIVFVIALLIGAVLAIAATRPDTYRVERHATIAAKPEVVFGVLNDLHHFHEWSPWQKLDPSMKVAFAGPEAGVGSSYSWEGNAKAGTGRMTITSSEPDSKVQFKLEFLKPFADTAQAELALAPADAGTTVTWSMSGRYNYISKVMCLFVSMDSMVGKDFDEGLANLKNVAEKLPAPADSTAAPAHS